MLVLQVGDLPMEYPPSRGLWYKVELEHINVLELKAIQIGIYTYCNNKNFLDVRVMCDNVTAIAYISNVSGIIREICNNTACNIWNFCTKNKLWVSTAHIPGKDNIEADQQSRILQDATEWKFHEKLFQKIIDKFGKPDINLFASRINRELKRYVSWNPEPETMAVNVILLLGITTIFTCSHILVLQVEHYQKSTGATPKQLQWHQIGQLNTGILK